MVLYYFIVLFYSVSRVVIDQMGLQADQVVGSFPRVDQSALERGTGSLTVSQAP